MEDSSRASFINSITDIFQCLNTRTEKLINDSGDPFDYNNLSYEEKAIVILSRMIPIIIFQNKMDKISSRPANVNSKIKTNHNLVNDNSQTPSNFEKDRKEPPKNTNINKGISINDLFEQISLIVDGKKKQNQTLRSITQTQIQRLYCVDQVSSFDQVSLQQKAKITLNQSIQIKTEIFSLEIENKNLKNQLSSYFNNQHKPHSNLIGSADTNQADYNNQKADFSMNFTEQQAKINKARSIVEKLQQENQLLEMKIDSYDRRINAMKISTNSHLSLAQRNLMNAPTKKQPSDNSKSDSPRGKFNGNDPNDANFAFVNENCGYDDTGQRKVYRIISKKIIKKRRYKIRNKSDTHSKSYKKKNEKSDKKPLLKEVEEEEENNRNDNDDKNEDKIKDSCTKPSCDVNNRSNRQPIDDDFCSNNERHEEEEEEPKKERIRSFEDIKRRYSSEQESQGGGEQESEVAFIRSFEDIKRRSSNRKSSMDNQRQNDESSDAAADGKPEGKRASAHSDEDEDDEMKKTIETATSSSGRSSPAFVAKQGSQRRHRQPSESETETADRNDQVNDITNRPDLLQTDDSKSGDDERSSNEEEGKEKEENKSAMQQSDSESEPEKQGAGINRQQASPSNPSSRPSSPDGDDEAGHSVYAIQREPSPSTPRRHAVRMPESPGSSSYNRNGSRHSASDDEKQKSDSSNDSEAPKTDEAADLNSKSDDDDDTEKVEDTIQDGQNVGRHVIPNPFKQPLRKFTLQGQKYYRKPQQIVRIPGRIIETSQAAEQQQPAAVHPGQTAKDAAMEVIEIIQKYKAMLHEEEEEVDENSQFSEIEEEEEDIENSQFSEIEEEEEEDEDIENSYFNEIEEEEEDKDTENSQFAEIDEEEEDKDTENSQFDEIEEEEEDKDDYESTEKEE